MKDARDPYEHIECPYCGQVFTAMRYKHKVFCSRHCALKMLAWDKRAQFELANPDKIHKKEKWFPHEISCGICGKSFMQEHPFTKYCSDACKKIAQKRQIKIWRKENRGRISEQRAKEYQRKKEKTKLAKEILHDFIDDKTGFKMYYCSTLKLTSLHKPCGQSGDCAGCPNYTKWSVK